MTKTQLIELMAEEFCDRMCEISGDGRRSRWANLKGWQRDRYRAAASAVLDLQLRVNPVVKKGGQCKRPSIATSKVKAVVKPKRPCVLRSIVVGERRLIRYESLMIALCREPTPDDPITVTRRKAVELSGLSVATINRMIAAGERVK